MKIIFDILLELWKSEAIATIVLLLNISEHYFQTYDITFKQPPEF